MPTGRKGSRREELPPEATGRAVEEYLAVLDDAAFDAAIEVVLKIRLSGRSGG
jgi:hypothetical protein